MQRPSPSTIFSRICYFSESGSKIFTSYASCLKTYCFSLCSSRYFSSRICNLKSCSFWHCKFYNISNWPRSEISGAEYFVPRMSSINCHIDSQGIVTKAGTTNSGSTRDPGHRLPGSAGLSRNDGEREGGRKEDWKKQEIEKRKSKEERKWY